MLDHYGSFPAPDKIDASSDITNRIIQIKSITQQTEIDKIRECARYIYDSSPPLFSYTALYMGGMDHYIELTLFEYKRKRILRRKVYGLFKTCARLITLHRNTCEKIYEPGGQFENEMSLYWNPIFRSS